MCLSLRMGDSLKNNMEIKLLNRKFNWNAAFFLELMRKIFIIVLGGLTSKYKSEPEINQKHQYLYDLEPNSVSNCYKILGLEHGNSCGLDIKAAYRKLIWIYHPDRVETVPDNVKEDAYIKSLKINSAYELLGRNGLLETKE